MTFKEIAKQIMWSVVALMMTPWITSYANRALNYTWYMADGLAVLIILASFYCLGHKLHYDLHNIKK